MKKTLVVGLAIGFASLVASSVLAGPSPNQGLPTQGYTGAKNVGGKGIVGSSHDLSNPYNYAAGTGAYSSALIAGGGDAQKRICVFCHHPHNAAPAAGKVGSTGGKTGAGGTTTGTLEYSPLWNRTMSSTTFAGYNNGIMMGGSSVAGTDKRHALNAADVGGGTKIAGVSLLCMSCHDGVVAMNAYSQSTGSSQNAGDTKLGGAIGSTAGFKGDMNNHHPMGFMYDKVQAVDAEIASVNVTMVPENGTKIGDLLYGANKTMECVTCHDVHNTQNQTGAERFLWRSDNNSNFCLTCHLK